MLGGLKSGRSEACVSDLQLDAWLAGELDAPRSEALLSHVASCDRCRARRAELEDARSRFLEQSAEIPPWLDEPDRTRVQSAAPRPAARARMLRIAAACAALAAAGAIAWLPPARAPAVRNKGGEYISFYVKRGEQVHRGALHERLRPGDKLRFAYTTGHARYLAILSLDGARRASVYYPADARAERVEPGVNVALPSAVVLDDVLGVEHLVALFCDRPLPVAELRAALETEQLAMQAPSGCAQDRVSVVKEEQ